MTSFNQSAPLRSWWDDAAYKRAKAAGKTTYVGDECNRGHGTSNGAPRYVKGRGCVTCSDNYRRRKAARGGTLASVNGRSGTREYRLWQAARKRAEDKGLDFTITIAEIVIPATCPVFGTPLASPSLDRFDNAKGYTPDNIRVISRRANTIKSDASRDDILAIARYMLNDEFEALLS